MATVSVKRRVILFVTSCCITVLYLLVFAAGMRALERPQEDDTLALTEILVHEVNLTKAQKERLHELQVCNWPDPEFPSWTLSGAMFYALTVITTIGYGSFAPHTQNGRSFTAFFAIIGISIIGQLLASCADLISGILKGLRQRQARRARQLARLAASSVASLRKGSRVAEEVEEEEGHDEEEDRQRVWEEAFRRWETGNDGSVPTESLTGLVADTLDDDPDPALVDHILEQVDPENTGILSRAGVARALLLFHTVETELPRGGSCKQVGLVTMLALVWILLWSVAFMNIEGWTYREAMWFCFVTMSTIGFGDFTPHTKLGRGLCFAFIVPGLGLGGATLGSIWNVFHSKRFWWLQNLHAKGTISGKMLEAHGIDVRFTNPAGIRRVRPHPRRAPGCRIGRQGTVRANATWAPQHTMCAGSPSAPVGSEAWEETPPLRVSITPVPINMVSPASILSQDLGASNCSRESPRMLGSFHGSPTATDMLRMSRNRSVGGTNPRTVPLSPRSAVTPPRRTRSEVVDAALAPPASNI
eukprot:Hpha_TRINITY_DN9719_c0_g1::TRINITY_DN9719_c0_g1_i1::g.10386::m.10386